MKNEELRVKGKGKVGAPVLRCCSAAVEVKAKAWVEGYTELPEKKIPIQELCRLMGNGVRAETRRSHPNV